MNKFIRKSFTSVTSFKTLISRLFLRRFKDKFFQRHYGINGSFGGLFFIR